MKKARCLGKHGEPCEFHAEGRNSYDVKKEAFTHGIKTGHLGWKRIRGWPGKNYFYFKAGTVQSKCE